MSGQPNERLDNENEQPLAAQTAEGVTPETDPDGLTEEEKREILSVFSETGENVPRRKKSFRFTVRNQIILLCGVLALAGLLLAGYFLFLREPEPVDAKYVPGEQALEVLDALGEDVELRICGTAGKEPDPEDPEAYDVCMYAERFADESRHVRLKYDSDGTERAVQVTSGDKTVTIPFGDFFAKRLFDGKVYGFAAERLLTNAVLEVTGGEKREIDVYPLDGFDKDGDDVLASGGVVMFPMVNKSDIELINVSNSHGDYTIYNNNGTFYFKDCELLQFDEELFASLIVDCRYVVTSGKLESQLDYAQYGLDKSENLTASFSLITKADSSGYSYLHTVWIGNKAASGNYYYALYYGSKLDSEGNTVENQLKPRIYKMPYSNVETNLLLRKEDYFKAELVYGVESATDCNNADYITLEYFYYDEEKPDVSFSVRNFPAFSFSDNTTSNESNSPEILKDKVSFDDTKLEYEDWTSEEQKGYFAGFNSSDANSFRITTVVTNIASDGKYEMTFGVLRDTDNATFAALMPESVTVRYSSDGENFKKVPEAKFDFASQKEDTVKKYGVTIQSEKPVLLIELTVTLPKTKGYFVLDDIRVEADGEDAQPNDALTGQWKMLSPAQYIPAGKNFAYLDSTNFSDFLYGLCTLEGDGVERVGIASHDPEKASDDTLDPEILAEYGLDRPAMHFAYEFNDFGTDLYVSAFDEEKGCYYAYSTITGDVYGTGKRICFCTGMVARLSPSTAAWLEWDPVEYIDHSLVGMYVYDIRKMEIAYEGHDYVIDVKANGKDLTSVKIGDAEFNEKNFRYLYLSVVQLNMKAEYVPSETEKPEEYLRIRIDSTSDSREYVFYRVSSSKAFYTVNGEGSYYCLVSALRNVTKKTDAFVAGEDLF